MHYTVWYWKEMLFWYLACILWDVFKQSVIIPLIPMATKTIIPAYCSHCKDMFWNLVSLGIKGSYHVIPGGLYLKGFIVMSEFFKLKLFSVWLSIWGAFSINKHQHFGCQSLRRDPWHFIHGETSAIESLECLSLLWC